MTTEHENLEIPVVIATDGACIGNPGPGGWGFVVMTTDELGVLSVTSGGAQHTTNQRMELEAVIRALEAQPTEQPLLILTDSEYVQKGITEWIHRWKRRGWKASSRKPVKNLDLWQRLDALNQARYVRWKWVRGHSGHIGNEAADRAAESEAKHRANEPTHRKEVLQK